MKQTLDKGFERYDYRKYNMKVTDIVIAFMIGFLIGAVVMHIFFGNIIVDVIVGAAGGIAAQPVYRKMRIESIKKSLTLQFKDLLDSLNSSYSSGKVVYTAFDEAQKDMKAMYGEDSYIYKELILINGGLRNGANIEELLLDLGERSGIEDIVNFANVFAVSNRMGGNIKHIINETKEIITEKIDIELDINALLSGAKNELYIMMCMPLIAVPMMSSFSSSEGDLTNIFIKIGGLVIFGVAFIIGRKITDIKL